MNIDDRIILVPQEEFQLYSGEAEEIYARILYDRLPTLPDNSQYIIVDSYPLFGGTAFIIREEQL